MPDSLQDQLADEVEIDAAFRPLKAKPAEALVAERGKTHGDWEKQAKLARELKDTFRHLHTSDMSEMQYEALEMILVKISRIGTGNASEPDHWDDIAGYALLGKQGHIRPKAEGV